MHAHSMGDRNGNSTQMKAMDVAIKAQINTFLSCTLLSGGEVIWFPDFDF